MLRQPMISFSQAYGRASEGASDCMVHYARKGSLQVRRKRRWGVDVVDKPQWIVFDTGKVGRTLSFSPLNVKEEAGGIVEHWRKHWFSFLGGIYTLDLGTRFSPQFSKNRGAYVWQSAWVPTPWSRPVRHVFTLRWAEERTRRRRACGSQHPSGYSGYI